MASRGVLPARPIMKKGEVMFREMLLALAALMPGVVHAAEAKPIAVKMVVVTAFEVGADTGDAPGEFQAWAETLPDVLPFPEGDRNLRFDPKTGVLAISTGMGTGRAAAAVMALGTDPRFDLRKAYWMIAAIAGVNPDTGSAGSAAWVGRVVDFDFGFEIDPREAPSGWATGRVPWDRTSPYEAPVPEDRSHNLFPLNLALRDWAYDLTRDIKLPDIDALKDIRKDYVGQVEAQKPPHVMVGDEITGQSFWHGKLLNDHATKWMAYWTKGEGTFVMTAMEDSGTLRSLQMLGKAGKVDPDRVLVLRTASNFTLPPPGTNAAASLAKESTNLSALRASLDAAFKVGSVVVREISGNWSRYAEMIPGK